MPSEQAAATVIAAACGSNGCTDPFLDTGPQVSVHSRKLGGLVINPSPGTFFTGWVRFL